MMVLTLGTFSERGIGGTDLEPVKKIPPASIYSTTNQEGFTKARPLPEEPYGFDLQELRKELRGGPSNVLFVTGKGIAEAMRATRMAFTTSRSADEPISAEGGKKGPSFWLVAYFGIAGSSPPRWHVEGVERKGNTVQVRYFTKDAGGETNDSHHYFLWAPLGDLDAGIYGVELFDVVRKEPTLTRRIRVSR